MPIIHISNLNEFNDLVKKENRVIFIKYSTSRCGPYRIIPPIYHDYSNKYNHIVFAEVDAGQASDIANFWHQWGPTSQTHWSN